MPFYSLRSSRPSLVRVRQPAHARHDTENVVVDGIQAEELRVVLVGVASRTCRRNALEHKRGIVNA